MEPSKSSFFGANFLDLRLFITVSLPIGKMLRTWTNRIRRFRWVKDSRIAVWTYTFSTKRWKLDVGFPKMQWTRFLDRGVSWVFYLLAYRKLLISYANWAFSCWKAKIIEVRCTSFLTPITAKSNSTIMTMVHVKITCKGQKEPREFPIYQTHMVVLHYSCRIPRNLTSVLEFRYQSLTLKYIKIELLASS